MKTLRGLQRKWINSRGPQDESNLGGDDRARELKGIQSSYSKKKTVAYDQSCDVTHDQSNASLGTTARSKDYGSIPRRLKLGFQRSNSRSGFFERYAVTVMSDEEQRTMKAIQDASERVSIANKLKEVRFQYDEDDDGRTSLSTRSSYESSSGAVYVVGPKVFGRRSLTHLDLPDAAFANDDTESLRLLMSGTKSRGIFSCFPSNTCSPSEACDNGTTTKDKTITTTTSDNSEEEILGSLYKTQISLVQSECRYPSQISDDSNSLSYEKLYRSEHRSPVGQRTNSASCEYELREFVSDCRFLCGCEELNDEDS